MLLSIISSVELCSLLCSQWKSHKLQCAPADCDQGCVSGEQRLAQDYDAFVSDNNEMLCFAVFCGLYQKLRTHVLFLELEYHPEAAAGCKFTIVPRSAVAHSLEEMLLQGDRNAAISKNLSDNSARLHTSTYTVGSCVVEVRGYAAGSGCEEPWARLQQFSREEGLSEASASVSVELVLQRINEGMRAAVAGTKT